MAAPIARIFPPEDDLAGQARPGHSLPGLAVTADALIVMPGLAIAKRRTGHALGNHALIAGLCRDRLLRAHLGGHVAGRRPERLARLVEGRSACLVIAVLAIKEGIEAREHDDCPPGC